MTSITDPKSPKLEIDGQESETLLQTSEDTTKVIDPTSAKHALGEMKEEEPDQARIVLKYVFNCN